VLLTRYDVVVDDAREQRAFQQRIFHVMVDLQTSEGLRTARQQLDQSTQ
jgi:hypothetical protein